MSRFTLCVVLFQILVHGESRPCCSGKGDGLSFSSLKQDAHPLKHQDGPSSLKHTDEAQKFVKIPHDGVFGVNADEVKSVSVMEGENVTLNTNLTEIQTDDQILWLFGLQGTRIAEIYNQKPYTYDKTGRYGGRRTINSQTGSLTITNITSTDSGLHELLIINSRGTLYKRFNVTVYDRLTVPITNQTQHLNITHVLTYPDENRLHVCAIAAAVVFVVFIVIVVAVKHC